MKNYRQMSTNETLQIGFLYIPKQGIELGANNSDTIVMKKGEVLIELVIDRRPKYGIEIANEWFIWT